MKERWRDKLRNRRNRRLFEREKREIQAKLAEAQRQPFQPSTTEQDASR